MEQCGSANAGKEITERVLFGYLGALVEHGAQRQRPLGCRLVLRTAGSFVRQLVRDDYCTTIS